MEKNDSGSSCEKINSKLRNLESLISHARQIENDTELLVRLIKEKETKAGLYRFDPSLAVNINNLREILADSVDFHFREFNIQSLDRKAAVVYLEGMSGEENINVNIIAKLIGPYNCDSVAARSDKVLEFLKDTRLTARGIVEENTLAGAVKRVLAGDTMLMVDGVASALVVATRSIENRSISEPETESAVRAPKEGFVEGLRINISLLRRRIKNQNLVVKKITIGEKTFTDLAVVYYRGIANPKLIEEVERRLKLVNMDGPAGIGVVEGIIEDHPYSLFPTMLVTERPDKVSASILEGRVAILMDGTPFCILAPGTLPDFFQSSDDYYEKWMAGSFFRFLRYISAFFAATSPAIYVAMSTFHPGLIPTPLTITIANARLGIPFPTFLEALIMEVMLEILQEAGVRLPKTIGPAVSIMGGLVIGEATVRAGLISAPMVIVIAFTAIASFNVANYRINLLVRLIRVPFLILGATFGAFGVLVGLLATGVHISLMESFGVPYLGTFLPRNTSDLTDLKDSIIVMPPAQMDDRPTFLSPEDKRRQKR